jgi:hypothetical protein
VFRVHSSTLAEEYQDSDPSCVSHFLHTASEFIHKVFEDERNHNWGQMDKNMYCFHNSAQG